MLFKKVGWNCTALCHHCTIQKGNFFDQPHLAAMQLVPRRDEDDFARNVTHELNGAKRH